ncbi:MAG: hypothetical protein CM1200mP30_02590 [Pseudomonadota bacterium]|nr:MAG: hypothetical protein CM1200mP30_02590 [Pseudomonadota bacterium]
MSCLGWPRCHNGKFPRAFAGGGSLVEYPMLSFPLGDEMLGDTFKISGGHLKCPDGPGLGVNLSEILKKVFLSMKQLFIHVRHLME